MWICEISSPVPTQMPEKAHTNCVVAAEFASGLATAGKNCLQQWDIDACVFLIEIQATQLITGVISRNTALTQAQLADLFEQCGLCPKDLSLTEITLKRLQRQLEYAQRHDYIEDADDVLEEYNLDKLLERKNRNLSEAILEERSKEELYAVAKDAHVGETMLPELERIYAGKQQSDFLGHPVHYLLQANEDRIHRLMYHTLLGALYANDRIQSKRYGLLTVDSGFRFDGKLLNDFYRANEGGTVILHFSAEEINEAADQAYLRTLLEKAETLYALARSYRNRVLTVFCCPSTCEKLKKSIYNALKDVAFVKLHEDSYEGESARSFLEELAKKAETCPDERLFAMPEPDRSYLGSELAKLFDSWYDNKLKTTAYPQYEAIHNALEKKPVQAAPEGSSAYDSLQELVGLGEAKSVISKAIKYFKMQKIYAERGVGLKRPAMHMCFTGNPGTAKTTVARLFARIMRDNGLLSKGQMVEVGRCDLVDRYIGWTAKAVQDAFANAKGGVLFIDEAYSLVDDRDGSFGDEAINTIVQEMENHREDVVVIFAGYSDKMEGFLRKNPGLRSRIAFHVPFVDYDAEELCQIAELLSKQKCVHLTSGARQKLKIAFDAARMQPDFGNGRYVRNVLEQTMMNQASRILSADYDSMTDDELCSICAEDIELPQIAEIEPEPESEPEPEPATRVIGFAV